MTALTVSLTMIAGRQQTADQPKVETSAPTKETSAPTENTATLTKLKALKANEPDKRLHLACSEGDLDVVKLLLQEGADPNLDYGYSNVFGLLRFGVSKKPIFAKGQAIDIVSDFENEDKEPDPPADTFTSKLIVNLSLAARITVSRLLVD